MDQKLKAILRRLHPKLVSTLNPDEDMYSHLYGEEIITADDRESLLKKDKRHRAEDLVFAIGDRGSKAFFGFLQALESSPQRQLAELLAKDAAPICFECKGLLCLVNINTVVYFPSCSRQNCCML